MLLPNQKTFTINGIEYLTRFGVEEEFMIKPTTFYKITTSRKMRYIRHPSFGRCVKREWVTDYFETQKNFR